MNASTRTMNNSATGGRSNPFDARLLVGLITAGLLAFVGYILLNAYAPDLQSGRNEGTTHALSRGATGFSAIVDLSRKAGIHVQTRRGNADKSIATRGATLILTPSHDISDNDIAETVRKHDGPVVIILPKWVTGNVPTNPGFVTKKVKQAMPLPSYPPGSFGSNARLSISRSTGTITGTVGGDAITLTLPEQPVVLRADRVQTLAGADDGSIIAASRRSRLIVITDPDLLNNRGIKDPARMRQAVTLIAALTKISPRRTVIFDLTLHGFSNDRSFLRLAMTPPFVGVTLLLFGGLLLGLWQGFFRFGPAVATRRLVPPGKRALLDNAAELFRQAGREHHGGGAYVHMIREEAARRLHAPSGLSPEALNYWLDRFVDSSGRHFSNLAAQLEAARNSQELVAGAQALDDWRKDVLRDNR